MSPYSDSRARTPVTADQLLRMPDDGWRYELLRGRLLREPPGPNTAGWA